MQKIIITVNSEEITKDTAQTLVDAIETLLQDKITAGTASVNAQVVDRLQ